ncbi:MAG: hypothetical protein JO267_12620 [Alphaproteobacteria bacterium]|nr:hypothetical protein [Alphaproteobacteria bacterium]
MFDAGFAAFVVGLVLLIFLLSLLLSAVNGEPSEGDRETSESDAADQQTNNSGNQHLLAAIADAIHAYRRHRHTSERNSAYRERVSIVVLGITAMFALGAGVAAIYSAVIFQGQLGEMRQATVDTRRLADTSRDAEIRQLRAYVSFHFVKMECPDCTTYRPGAFPAFSNTDLFYWKETNHGLTPANNVYVTMCYNDLTPPFVDQIPDLPPCAPAEHPFKYTIYPGDPRNSETSIDLDKVAPAYLGQKVYVHYGAVIYDDIFGCPRKTQYCFILAKVRTNQAMMALCPRYNGPDEKDCEK